MDISVQSFKRADLINVSGRVDSSNAPQLDSRLKEMINDGRYNLILNLSAVDYMSSAGLRTLVSALRDCKKKGGDVRIAQPSDRVSEVLTLAGLDSVFQVYDDTTKAVGSY
jgi:anti-sigma B factor antagonist